MRICCLLVVVFLCNLSFGQRANDGWIEVRGKLGFLAAHRSVLGHLPVEHAYAVEVSYLLQSRGKKAWQSAYKYPVYGITGFAGSVGNEKLLGNFYGLYGFMKFPFVSRKHYVFSGKLGCGLGYGTKHYDPETNILGIAVSSSVNAQIVLALENRFTFGNNSITAAIDMTHFSNGAMKVPNFGLNLPFISLGYGYRIKEREDSLYVHEPFKKSWGFGITAIGSHKEVFPAGGRKYPIIALSLHARRYFRPKTGMEISFDIMSKQSTMDLQEDVPKRQDEIIQLGAFVGYILPLDKFQFITGMGIYVRDKFKPDGLLYHRVGMRYILNNGMNINLVLKSHWARADYVEFGFGYTLKR